LSSIFTNPKQLLQGLNKTEKAKTFLLETKGVKKQAKKPENLKKTI